MRRRFAALFCALLAFVSHATASPEIEGVSTFALRSGGETEISIRGSSLRETTGLWLSVPATATLIGKPRDNQVKFRIVLNTNSSGFVWMRVVASNGVSNLRGFVVDSLRTEPVSGTNRSRSAAQRITSPMAVEGATEDLAVCWFKCVAKKRERVTFEVVATRLGSRLDSVLRVVDARGRELASNDDAPGIRGDSMLTFEAPEAGDYFIELRDVNYAGGRDYFYRMQLGGHALPRRAPGAEQAEREPNNTATTATPIKVPSTFSGGFDSANDLDLFRVTAQARQEIKIRARTRSIGAGCDVELRIENAKGHVLAQSNVNAADEGVVTHTFAETGEYQLVVREVTGAFGPTAFYLIEATEAPGFTLTLDNDRVEAPAGGVFKLKVNAVRSGYKGPIALAISDFDGVALTNGVIAQGTTNVTMTGIVSTNLVSGTAHVFKVVGAAPSRAIASVTASIATAWQKTFPQMLYAPLELEPFVILGVTSK